MKGLHTNVAYFGGTVAIAVLVMTFVVKATAWKFPVESWALARAGSSWDKSTWVIRRRVVCL